MAKNDGLMMAAIIGGVLILPGLLNRGDNGGGISLLGFGQGDQPGLDLGGLFGGGGAGIFGGLNDLFSGVGDLLGGQAGVYDSLGNFFDNFSFPDKWSFM